MTFADIFSCIQGWQISLRMDQSNTFIIIEIDQLES